MNWTGEPRASVLADVVSHSIWLEYLWFDCLRRKDRPFLLPSDKFSQLFDFAVIRGYCKIRVNTIVVSSTSRR
jgi:hypothetical protein